jgi:predicted Zn-dependent protease
MRLRNTIALGLALTFGVGGTVSYAQFKPSAQDQVRLGQEAAADIRKKERVLPQNDSRVVLLNQVARRLLSTIDTSREPWRYSFDVIDSKDVNAFAFPGGPVFFYTGLLDKLKTEDQLAGILAHEMTHIRQEHWAKSYNDAQKRNILVNLGLILFRANRTIGDVAGLVNGLYTLKYSRGAETEADDRGFDMMVKADYNPQGMVDVFKILKAAGGSKAPEILSSHPTDDARIRRMEEKAKTLPGNFKSQRPLPWAG